jgi:Uma2 family endonuclease
MKTMAVIERMTADAYLALPLEGRRTELVGGELVVHEPRPRHQEIVWRLVVALATWERAAPGRARGSLPLDVRVDDDNVFAPDLLVYASGREPGPDDQPSPLPEIAVEVRSPSTWRHDVGAKKSVYEAAGLPELWLVDTDVVLVFRRSRPDAPTFDVALELDASCTITSPLLPGFVLPVAELFVRGN